MPENLESENSHREKLRQALEDVIANPEEPIIATTIRRGWQSSAKPVLVRGIDGNEYVVKGKQAGRQIINDRVAAKLGQAMQAPVGEPYLVEISQELLDLELEFSYLATGVAHATKFIPNCSDDHGEFLYASSSVNHSRFASLAVLYGWIYADDHQFLRENQSPRLVYSVDHGHFFVGGPDWTIEHLSNYLNPAKPDHLLVRNCKLNNEDLIPTLAALGRISEQTIVQIVGGVPEEWGISIDERLTLVEYLIKRQHELLANF
ncbi:MAG: HipA family kinase [Pseudanabaena sp.]